MYVQENWSDTVHPNMAERLTYNIQRYEFDKKKRQNLSDIVEKESTRSPRLSDCHFSDLQKTTFLKRKTGRGNWIVLRKPLGCHA